MSILSGLLLPFEATSPLVDIAFGCSLALFLPFSRALLHFLLASTGTSCTYVVHIHTNEINKYIKIFFKEYLPFFETEIHYVALAWRSHVDQAGLRFIKIYLPWPPF